MPNRVQSPCRWQAAAILFLSILFLAGCSGALPTSEQLTKSSWNSFDEVKAAYDKVSPGVTTAEQLRAAGFDPYVSPNVHVLSYLDIMRHFLTSDAIRPADLDPAVQACIRAREACTGYQVAFEHIHRERKGSAFLDLFNFRRQTYETGWEFSALFVLQGGRVTYKLWSGMPKIDRRMEQDNPLGPVQEPAPIIRNRIPGV